MKTHVHEKMLFESYKILPDYFKSFYDDSLNGRKIIDIIACGAYIEDTTTGPLGKAKEELTPWLEHFWQQNLGTIGLNAAYDFWYMDNCRAAYRRAEDYISTYVMDKWRTGNSIEKEEALLNLGRVIHLLQDMGVPAHTNNDPHPWFDSFEDYIGEKCEEDIPYSYSANNSISPFFTEDNLQIDMKNFFSRFASETIKYDSDDVTGKGDGLPYRHSWHTRDWFLFLSDASCNMIAKNLLPLSYCHVSSLLIAFLNEIHKTTGALSTEKNYFLNNYQLDFELLELKINDNQAIGDAEVFIRTVNGTREKNIPTDKTGLGLKWRYTLEDNSTISVNENLTSRTINRNEGAYIYMEIIDEDTTFDDIIDKIHFRIDFNTISDVLDTEKTKKITVAGEGNNSEVTLGVKAKTITSSGSPIILEHVKPLKFFKLTGKSNSSNDKIVFTCNGKNIVSSYEDITLKYFHRFYYVSFPGVTVSSPWDEWKNVIPKGSVEKQISLNTFGINRTPKAEIKIKEYHMPSSKYDGNSDYFDIEVIIHSIEEKIESDKYNIQFLNFSCFKKKNLSKSSSLNLSLPYQNVSELSIDSSLWNNWIENGIALFRHNAENLRYNLFICVKPIKKSYIITHSISVSHIHVYDDTDSCGAGEIYGTCNGIKRYFGSIKSGKGKNLNASFGEQTSYTQEDSHISASVHVWDCDSWLFSPNATDSLGTVKLDLSPKEWNIFDKGQDKVTITTPSILSSNKKCKLTFKVTITREEIKPIISADSLQASPQASNQIAPVTISDELNKLPLYRKEAYEKSIHKDFEKTDFLWYSELDESWILHHHSCYHLEKVDPINRKKVCISLPELKELQSIEDIDILNPDVVCDRLEKKIVSLKKSPSISYLTIKGQKARIPSQSTEEIKKQLNELPNNKKINAKIISKPIPSDIETKEEFHLKKDIKRLSEFQSKLTQEEKDSVYRTRRLVKEGRLCKTCLARIVNKI